MNRLIILGNGFDLSHGLKTKYSDFIEYYWKQITSSNHRSDMVKLHCRFDFEIPVAKNLLHFLTNVDQLTKWKRHNANGWNDYTWYESDDTSRLTMDINNVLFHELCKNFDDVYWSDIEMLYYKLLKEICPTGSPTQENILAVRKLNADIRQLTEHFKSYLLMEIEPSMSSDELCVQDYDDMFERPFIYSDLELKNIMREYSHEFTQLLKEGKTQKIPNSKILNAGVFLDTLILNFNYTNTVNIYNNTLGRDYSEIKIHGSITDSKNEILLGFGDEKDEFYQVLEGLNRNEFLEFMKSSHYAKNDNYKRLFDFIESDVFQVQIIGHSCGLSDRTLLNSIFQHKNCMSIKIFYYEYEGRDEYNETDNFSQIFRNISRHFSDKKNMRDRIVNKTYCSKLPQSHWKHGS